MNRVNKTGTAKPKASHLSVALRSICVYKYFSETNIITFIKHVYE